MRISECDDMHVEAVLNDTGEGIAGLVFEFYGGSMNFYADDGEVYYLDDADCTVKSARYI